MTRVLLIGWTNNEAIDTNQRADHRDLHEHEVGAKCADLCRMHGMSESRFYAWKAKYSGMTVPEAKRLKALEDEDAMLRKLMTEHMLDKAAMKELLSINGNARCEA